MLRGFVSLSAVDKDSAESYMKIIMSFIMAYHFEYDSTYRRKTNMWYARVDPFVRRFKLNRSRLEKAHKALAAGKDPENDAAFDKLIVQIIEELQAKTPEMKKELDLRREDIGILNDMRLIFTKDSDAARRRLSKAVSRFQDPDINEMFLAEHEDTSGEQSELEKLVKKYNPSGGLTLPLPILQQWQQVAKVKGAKVKDHERYLKLRSSLNKSFKSRLLTLVRSSGKNYLPLRTVVETLEAEGVPHTLPKGFVGLIDDQGKFYTTAGKKLIQAPTGEVRMNPEYDAKEDNAYVCSFLPEGAPKEARAYTEAYRAQSKQKKFAAVQDTMPKINTLAKKWRTDMKEGNTSKGVIATMLELIFDTAARPGNPGNATKGERTFGITQLQAKHFKVDDTKIVIKYKGKSQSSNTEAMQTHILNYNSSAPLKLLAKNLKGYLKNKKPTDNVFQYKGKNFTSTSITRYMRTLGFHKDFTVHKFRTVRATKMASDTLKKSPFKKGGSWTEREVNQWVETQMLKVGQELGHTSNDKVTSNTAIQNYIAPEILADFYGKLGIRPPAKIQKAIDSAGKEK